MKAIKIGANSICWLAVFGWFGIASADPNPESIDECQVIGEPGSYILENNIPTDGEYLPFDDCLVIQTDHVTIDLNGFSVVGMGNGFGIYGGGHRNIEVRNGTVRGFGEGIRALVDAKSHRFIDLRSLDNSGSGFLVDGDGHLVKNCTAAGNAFSGIALGANNPPGLPIPFGIGSTVIDSIASSNGSFGILARGASLISRSEANDNGSAGILVGGGSTVSGSTANDNGNSGITVQGGTVSIIGNTANRNQLNGIDAGGTSTVKSNIANRNAGNGISASLGTVVDGNSANFNGGDGILVLNGSASVTGNVASRNDGRGINVGPNTTLIGNTAVQNGQEGILADFSLVDQNTAAGNGSANIQCNVANCTIGTNQVGP